MRPRTENQFELKKKVQKKKSQDLTVTTAVALWDIKVLCMICNMNVKHKVGGGKDRILWSERKVSDTSLYRHHRKFWGFLKLVIFFRNIRHDLLLSNNTAVS